MKNKSFWILYLGALPFIICVLLSYYNFHTIPLLGNIHKLFYSYSLIIIGFMSGCIWGHYINKKNELDFKLAIISNIITLVAWFTFLILPYYILGYIYAACFIFLFCIDCYLLKIKYINGAYLIHRMIISSVVIATIIINSAFLVN